MSNDRTEPTHFVESNALLAVQGGDDEHAVELLADMLPGELRSLARACDRLARLTREELSTR